MRPLLVSILLLTATSLLAAGPKPGSVIFIHPDGTALNTWNAARIYLAGPDAMLEWDHLPHVGLYRSHFKDSLHPTSHGGGTVHAWGVKVVRNSYGMDGQTPIRARSGADKSVMQEAQAAGLAAGVINSGHVAEPGSGVFLASSQRRADFTGITKTILESGAEVILAGGEIYMLPEDVTGRHGQPGVRTDGLDLIAAASTCTSRSLFARGAGGRPTCLSSFSDTRRSNETFMAIGRSPLLAKNRFRFNQCFATTPLPFDNHPPGPPVSLFCI
jgi:alkaline phosphatase